ncbi:TetR family transcriptional regulator [Mycolicibacterium thermoresistibile ATCC 19527]|uniref:TetR family transcriptional regulator n=2 Tax=Mycolicibacterium thermoresistibile TaxID=1797 RepID=G7CGC0_MYCT3|nr:TetR family transcriptional regulator [Mycolicibacterium thermoresistibile ATCC 19527]MCV7188020.1 TetR/AcrR family transcriptional regulator [Mycolicibacterium thermoresistibile]GAT15199.1 TetR family transcriptional regulator [Mycolicibacterium thermoresistibile]
MDSDAAAPGVRKSDRTRLTILDAARVAFARKGFSGVTIRDITDLAGVTRANFYYYFKDKTELFVELGTATYREVLEVIETFSDTASPVIIDQWVSRYFTYLDRNGAFVIRSEEDMPQDGAFRTAVARSHRRAAQALGQQIAKASSTPLAADEAATGLVVMAMLERSWLIHHNGVFDAPRDVVLAAASEVIRRLVEDDGRPGTSIQEILPRVSVEPQRCRDGTQLEPGRAPAQQALASHRHASGSTWPHRPEVIRATGRTQT